MTPTPSALQEKLKKVQEENQRLQNKVLRLDQEPARDQDLEERYNKLLEVMTACSFWASFALLWGEGEGLYFALAARFASLDIVHKSERETQQRSTPSETIEHPLTLHLASILIQAFT